jgi:hypothetical protein
MNKTLAKQTDRKCLERPTVLTPTEMKQIAGGDGHPDTAPGPNPAAEPAGYNQPSGGPPLGAIRFTKPTKTRRVPAAVRRCLLSAASRVLSTKSGHRNGQSHPVA